MCMRKPIRFSIGLVLSCFFFLAAGRCWAQNQPPVVDENETHGRKLLDDAIAALGGDAYLSVKDITLVGRFYQIYHGTASGASVFTDYLKYPDMERQELGKKKENIVIYNGDKAWDVDFRGVHPMLPAHIKEYWRTQKYSLDRILRMDLKTKNYRIYYDETDYVQPTTYDVVTLEDSHRERMSILINPQTHLPEAIRYRFKAADGSGVDRMESWFGNYHPVQGIMTPYHRDRIRNGERISETFVNEVKYNSGLPDSLFTPQKK